jgi:aryl-alcohol dehydrogenase-like predicted oxidoreductase
VIYKIITIGKGPAEMGVSSIGYGCMGLTAMYGDITPEADAIAVLRKAYDLGVRHFDTAQGYRQEDKNGVTHYNEELVGKFLKTLSDDERKDVTVATKFFPMNAKWEMVFEEDWFIEQTKASLKRLQVDCIDLYYFHRVYPQNVCAVDVWMGAAKKLVEQGLIKRIGLSEANATIIREAHKIHPITAIQQEWSLFARDLEKEIVPTCQELGIGIIAYSPIGRGFLAGKFTSKEDAPKDWRGTNVPYLSAENIEKNQKILEELKAIAASKNCSTGQLCLSWLVHKGAVPIPGTTKVHHLEDNMAALNVTLSDEEIQKLGDLGDQVVGERGTEDYMARTFHNV